MNKEYSYLSSTRIDYAEPGDKERKGIEYLNKKEYDELNKSLSYVRQKLWRWNKC
jgi:hypothetical protein